MEFHKLAELFPLMHGGEYDQLKADIVTNGLLEPIWLYENKILDGRNRYLACADIGIEAEYKTYTATDPLGFVLSMNLHRRHLNETQRAVVASKLANMQLGDNQYKNGSVNLPTHSQSEAANKLNISTSMVGRVKAIERTAPELMPKLESGDMTAHEAYKIIKMQERAEIIQEQMVAIENNLYSPPTGKYDVIVIDPPWPYGTKYDPSGRRAASPYPEMSLDEIKNIKIPASDDCVLWLWITHKFMRYAFDILDHWDFRDVAILTWVKDRMGLGSWLRSQSEFCIMAVRGCPIINLTNQTTVIHGGMREHSRKPDEFYNMVDQLCIGYKIDWFSRESRDGWTQYGNDKDKFQ